MLRMTRAELHALVWAMPMTEIARKYAVRDQHVAQACDANGIARPPAGYWQRLAYGKQTAILALDNASYSPGEVITIHPAVGRSSRLHKGDDDVTVRRRAA